jgi:hypothetical protein
MTCPSWQCGPVAQNTNMGSVLVTGMLKVPTSVWPSVKGICPLCIPPWRAVHGFSNVLCVAVWLPLLNWNWTISPTAAVRVLGVKVSWGPPTTTVRASALGLTARVDGKYTKCLIIIDGMACVPFGRALATAANRREAANTFMIGVLCDLFCF